MDAQRGARLVETALRCYPARWRRRHGEEAAELAALLIRDGAPVGSITCSYLAGAAREWLTPRPGRYLRMVACALLALTCSLGISVGLLASTASARAASTTHARGHAHCRPGGSHQPRPGATPATGHPRPNSGQAHDRSC